MRNRHRNSKQFCIYPVLNNKAIYFYCFLSSSFKQNFSTHLWKKLYMHNSKIFKARARVIAQT